MAISCLTLSRVCFYVSTVNLESESVQRLKCLYRARLRVRTCARVRVSTCPDVGDFTPRVRPRPPPARFTYFGDLCRPSRDFNIYKSHFSLSAAAPLCTSAQLLLPRPLNLADSSDPQTLRHISSHVLPVLTVFIIIHGSTNWNPTAFRGVPLAWVTLHCTFLLTK